MRLNKSTIQSKSQIITKISVSGLYISNRFLYQIGVSINFLMTCVMFPYKYYQINIMICMRYIKVTTHLPLILWLDKTNALKLYVNNSYLFHQVDKIHTGEILSLVKVSIINGSNKHNINTKTSMEVELRVVGDFSPHIIYKKCFLNGKYFGVDSTNLYQNKSVILLENTSCVSIRNHTNT